MGFKYSFLGIFLILFLLALRTQAQQEAKVFNVMNYGAVADGSSDNSKAFLKAWEEACQWTGNSRVYIPSGTYLLHEVTFEGPCNGQMEFMVQGVLKAPSELSMFYNDKWIQFQHISGLIVNGGGTLDGQGAKTWPFNTCDKKITCPAFPTTIRFNYVNHTRAQGLRIINSKNAHVIIYGCSNMTMSNINITAPGDSPNTDGIKIGRSKNVTIVNSNISTGDDCVALLDGAKFIEISDVACGPGHGISIGSLGRDRDVEEMIGIVVRNCSFHNTKNGVRLKTWASPYKGEVSHLVYENIVMNNVENPILIDQEYCPHDLCGHEASSHVQISNVLFKNITGTSETQTALNLKCSQERPCKDIRLEDINLIYKSIETPVWSYCSHVSGSHHGFHRPPPCI